MRSKLIFRASAWKWHKLHEIEWNSRVHRVHYRLQCVPSRRSSAGVRGRQKKNGRNVKQTNERTDECTGLNEPWHNQLIGFDEKKRTALNHTELKWVRKGLALLWAMRWTKVNRGFRFISIFLFSPPIIYEAKIHCRAANYGLMELMSVVRSCASRRIFHSFRLFAPVSELR